MSRDALSGRDLRAVSAINYQLYAEEVMKKLQVIIEKIGQKITESLDKRRDIIYGIRYGNKRITREEQKELNQILNEVDHLQSIMSTAGYPPTNDLLTTNINELHDSINPDYPYDFPSPMKIMMCTNRAIGSFKLAVSKHWQRKEGLTERIQEHAFGSQAILGEPQVKHLSLKRMLGRDENVMED